MTTEEQRVWTYLLANRKADAEEVTKNVKGVSLEFVNATMARIASTNWREAV